VDLWVVVPAYNEERGIGATLRALQAQQDRDFRLGASPPGWS
jgi:glycosyltransferase involved in cell wall biosynthesis